jgi:hypothetical protein
MKTKSYFAFRIDVWDSAGNGIAEHLAGLVAGRRAMNTQKITTQTNAR